MIPGDVEVEVDGEPLEEQVVSIVEEIMTAETVDETLAEPAVDLSPFHAFGASRADDSWVSGKSMKKKKKTMTT